MNAPRSTWESSRKNVSQGGGVSISFRAGDEESVKADSEARNANQSRHTNFPSGFGSGQEQSTTPRSSGG